MWALAQQLYSRVAENLLGVWPKHEILRRGAVAGWQYNGKWSSGCGLALHFFCWYRPLVNAFLQPCLFIAGQASLCLY